jgi:hypothetical protein
MSGKFNGSSGFSRVHGVQGQIRKTPAKIESRVAEVDAKIVADPANFVRAPALLTWLRWSKR